MPATLPAIMAVMFEPLPPDDDDGVVADIGVPLEDALDVAEGMTDALEGPRIEPGTGSGESIKKMSSETVNRREKRLKRRYPPPTAYDLLGFQLFSFWSALRLKCFRGIISNVL